VSRNRGAQVTPLHRSVIAGAGVGLLLVACYSDPQEKQQSSNAGFTVDVLFDVEGCRVYRFGDGGRVHYFARCNGGTLTTGTRSEPCGKNCTRDVTDELPTVEVRP
jgi:hypothetical protein